MNGQCPNISALLRIPFWQPVYYTLEEDKNTGYSQPEEKLGRFVGFAENVGNVMPNRHMNLYHEPIFVLLMILPSRTSMLAYIPKMVMLNQLIILLLLLSC